jgi:hypothetical protein
MNERLREHIKNYLHKFLAYPSAPSLVMDFLGATEADPARTS